MHEEQLTTFLCIAKGSLMETETFFMLAVRLNYLNPEQANPTTLSQITEITKMLTSLRYRILNTP
jgi:four helix bundle protein